MRRQNSQNAPSSISITVVESTPLACRLLSDGLARYRNQFDLAASAYTFQDAVKRIVENKPDVAVISSHLENDCTAGFKIVRYLHIRGSSTRPVLLLDCSAPEPVIKAFAVGAKGVFCRSESFETLCKCIESIHAGQIWANSNQLEWIVSALGEKQPIRLFSAKGTPLLTKRAEQIIGMVAEGMPNSDIASELGVSAHTIKNHLFRIYEKLGISSRVELLLYALSARSNSNNQE